MTSTDLLLHGPTFLLSIVVAVAVPFGLRVANTPSPLVVYGMPAGFVVASSLWLSPGPLAVVLAVPYAAITAWAGVVGLQRVFAMRRAPRDPAAFAIAAGLAFLPGAAVWLLAHRAGYALLGFPAVAVALTAAHFHVAGAILAIVVGTCALGRGRLAGFTAVACVVSVPLTALGILASNEVGGEPGLLEHAGSLAMVVSALGGAIVVGMAGVARREPALVVAAAALAIAMLFALAFALRLGIALFGLDPLTTMIVTHAVLNVGGFALVAVFALSRAAAAAGS